MDDVCGVWHLLMGQAFRDETACPYVSGYRRFGVFVAVMFMSQAAVTGPLNMTPAPQSFATSLNSHPS
jgi:hypothetical protein